MTTGPTTDQVAAGPALADAAGEENCTAPSQATEESTWSLERPPRLFEDFGGEAGRCSYERAREQWYHRFTCTELPPYNPLGADRRQQVSARAPLWHQAVRAYKDKQRDRSDRMRPEDDSARRKLGEKRLQQEAWVDDVTLILESETAGEADWPWPACNWLDDFDKLELLEKYMLAHPPTGDPAWCAEVEARAAALFLEYGEFWDDVEAPGYRLLTSLSSAPRELFDLPMGDRLWIRYVNEIMGCSNTIRSLATRGDLHGAIECLWKMAYAQYIGQHKQSRGIGRAKDYIATVGASLDVPVADEVFHWLEHGSDLFFSPQRQGKQREQGVPSLERPRTEHPMSHELQPWIRQRIMERGLNTKIKEGRYDVDRCKPGGLLWPYSGFIPYGDLYRLDAVVHAVRDFVRERGRSTTLDLNKVMSAGVMTGKPDLASAICSTDQPFSVCIRVTPPQNPVSHPRYCVEELLRLGFNRARFDGHRVQLDHLRQRVDLNREFGVVVPTQANCDRIAVRLESGDCVKLKPNTVFLTELPKLNPTETNDRRNSDSAGEAMTDDGWAKTNDAIRSALKSSDFWQAHSSTLIDSDGYASWSESESDEGP